MTVLKPRRWPVILGGAVLLILLLSIVDSLLRPAYPCKRCGNALSPFKAGDPEWIGSGIYECRRCGFMINFRHGG